MRCQAPRTKAGPHAPCLEDRCLGGPWPQKTWQSPTPCPPPRLTWPHLNEARWWVHGGVDVAHEHHVLAPDNLQPQGDLRVLVAHHYPLPGPCSGKERGLAVSARFCVPYQV